MKKKNTITLMQKLLIYDYARIYLEQKSFPPFGMCDAIAEGYNYVIYNGEAAFRLHYTEVYEKFPDFAALGEGKTLGNYWWNRTYREIRLQNFDKLIDNVKKEINENKSN